MAGRWPCVSPSSSLRATFGTTSESRATEALCHCVGRGCMRFWWAKEEWIGGGVTSESDAEGGGGVGKGQLASFWPESAGHGSNHGHGSTICVVNHLLAWQLGCDQTPECKPNPRSLVTCVLCKKKSKDGMPFAAL